MSMMQVIAALMKKASAAVYATWNPADKGANVSLSNGNLTALNVAGSNELVRSTLGKSTGKWYWELTVGAVRQDLGVANASESLTTFTGASANSTGYNSSGSIFRNSSVLASVAAYAPGDVIGIALDMTAGTVAFYKNNVLQYTATGLTGTMYAAGGGTSSSPSSVTANFGATALVYSPPAGFNAGLYT